MLLDNSTTRNKGQERPFVKNIKKPPRDRLVLKCQKLVDRYPRSEKDLFHSVLKHVLLENSDRKLSKNLSRPSRLCKLKRILQSMSSVPVCSSVVRPRVSNVLVCKSITLCWSPSPLAPLEQLWRVNYQQNHHDRKHRHRVKDVQKHFVAVDVSPRTPGCIVRLSQRFSQG